MWCLILLKISKYRLLFFLSLNGYRVWSIISMQIKLLVLSLYKRSFIPKLPVFIPCYPMCQYWHCKHQQHFLVDQQYIHIKQRNIVFTVKILKSYSNISGCYYNPDGNYIQVRDPENQGALTFNFKKSKKKLFVNVKAQIHSTSYHQCLNTNL